MSMFDLKGGSSNSWNYSQQDKEGYMEQISGTVVEISNPQVRNFQTKQPEFWPDGNPKRQLCVIIKGQSGKELAWYFAPRSKAADACLFALDPNGLKPRVSIEEMLGKWVTVSTQPGVYNNQNPRPWNVVITGDGDTASVRGMVDLSKQQQQQPQQAQQLQQFQQPQQAQQFQQPQQYQQQPQQMPQVQYNGQPVQVQEVSAAQYAAQQAAAAAGYPQEAQPAPYADSDIPF